MENVVEKELEMLMACQSEAEREALIERLKKLHADDTEEIIAENLRELNSKVNELTVELKLLMVSKYGISLTYMAEKFLGKSRSYLSQRLHGNPVNGKVAKLTAGEIECIRNGLNNMSDELRDLASSLG